MLIGLTVDPLRVQMPCLNVGVRLSACRLAHLHSHQPRDQDRQVELAGDTFSDRRVAGLQSDGCDVAKPDGRECSEAEIDENRDSLLLRSRTRATEAEGIRLQVVKYDIEKPKCQSYQQVGRNRHADDFPSDLLLPQYRAQFIPRNEGKEQQPQKRAGQIERTAWCENNDQSFRNRGNSQRPGNDASPPSLG